MWDALARLRHIVGLLRFGSRDDLGRRSESDAAIPLWRTPSRVGSSAHVFKLQRW